MIGQSHIPVPEDVDAIMAIMAEAFDPEYREAWTRRQVEDALRTGHCHYALLPASDAPGDRWAGFTLSRHGFEDEELLLFAVRPDCRRRGIGRALIAVFLDAARERGARRVFLEMREGNPAMALYESCGFNRIGRRADYYRTISGQKIDAITYAFEFEAAL